MSRGLDVESSFYLRVIDPNYLYSSHPYCKVYIPTYLRNIQTNGYQSCHFVHRAIAPKSLIFMRRYEVKDFPCSFLTIYKMDVSTKIKYFKLQTAIAPKSLIFMRRYEVTDFLCSFLTIFCKWTSRLRSNTLNYRTHIHSTKVINIHEKV